MFLEEDIVSTRHYLTQDYTNFLSWHLLCNREGSKMPSFPSHNIGGEMRRNNTGFKQIELFVWSKLGLSLLNDFSAVTHPAAPILFRSQSISVSDWRQYWENGLSYVFYEIGLQNGTYLTE